MASLRQHRMRSTVVHSATSAPSAPSRRESLSSASSSAPPPGCTPKENEALDAGGIVGRLCAPGPDLELLAGAAFGLLLGERDKVLRFDWRRSESSWSMLRLAELFKLAS